MPDNPVHALKAALPKNGNHKEHHKALPYAAVSGALRVVAASGAWWATRCVRLSLSGADSGALRRGPGPALDRD